MAGLDSEASYHDRLHRVITETAEKIGITLKDKQFQAIYSFCLQKDVFVSLPTGYGKSVIYGILPLIFDNIKGSPNTPASLGENNDSTVESPAEPQVTKKPLSRDQSKDNDDTISPEPVGAVAVLPGDKGSSRLASDSPLPVDPAVVVGSKAVEAAYQEGKWPVVDKTVDVYALQCSSDVKPQIYYMAIIDVLTTYSARKRAAHAAKTFKTRHGSEISTVNPELYARRFLEFMAKIME